ncbi:hypothetical protein PIB30_006496 [Stylosanthes scabra]|uniref:Uncharacterized protein n=1 Tax=Stylosanthes scabra TaxID=79078 RepID=A0ABU6V659_9FABA|nr:hypothetical protein [Stylosanthes scabra]
MAESSNGHSKENGPPGRRSVTPHNLNLNLGTPRGAIGDEVLQQVPGRGTLHAHHGIYTNTLPEPQLV